MREYMRELNENMGRWFTPAVKWLFYLCIGTFIVQLLFGGLLIRWLGASPATTLARLQLWQLVTYMFVHGSVMHLVLNLLSLWFFGMQLEERWGTERFVKFVIFVGGCAVLFHLLITTALSIRTVPLSEIGAYIIGISGVCYGVMLAFAYHWPDAPIYFYGIFPVKAKILVAILGVMVLLGSAGRGDDNIAHFTHLGGFLFGFIFVKFQNLFDRIPMPRLPGKRRRPQYRDGGRWRDF